MVDWELRDEIKSVRLLIDPFDEKLIQPNSIDVRLGKQFTWYTNLVPEDEHDLVDPYDPNTQYQGRMQSNYVEQFIIEPGQFVLGATVEKFRLPSSIVGQLTGKSSLARLGIMVHVTAGFIDAGFIR